MADTLFSYILDMTLRGSAVIIAVLLVRLLLKKAPKVFSYALWAVVLFRLFCPLSIQLPVSVVPDMESVAESYRFDHDPITVMDAGKAVYQAAGDAARGELNAQQVYIDVPSSLGGHRLRAATLLEICVMAGQYLWLAGVAGFLIYGIVSYLLLRRRLIGAVRLRDNIWLADHIETPFVLGLIKPRICLPSALQEGERDYIIAHEQHHIKRYDHVIKLLAFVALTLHWFNPLVWLAYVLFCKDMEMSCDEAVIKTLGENIRADYCASLLKLSTGRQRVGIAPLAFGEGDTKGRIENLAKWKKPLIWVVIGSVLLCLVAGLCLLSDPTPRENMKTPADTQTDPVQPGGTSPEEVFDITLSHAGYTGEASLYAGALNAPAMAISSVQHLPIYKFDTRSELDSFMGTYGKFLSMNAGYDEVPSFYGVAERYDEAFFAEKTLMLVYITAGSGSYRYGVDSIHCGGNSFTVHVKKTKAPQDHTDNMAGWFLTVAVPDSMVRNCTSFDADLDNTSFAHRNGRPQVTRVEQTDQETLYYIEAFLTATDFSSLSNKVKNKVSAEWNTFDRMTQWEHALSSHLSGIIYMDADSWAQCEKDLGIQVHNPLENISWLTVTDSYGGVSTQPNAPHVETTVYATAASNREIESILIEAGYKTEGVRVMLDARVQGDGGSCVVGIADLDRVNFMSEDMTTGSGIPVLLTWSDADVNYSSLKGWWVQDNVLYTVHLVGEKGADETVRTSMEQLLAAI